MPFKTFEEWNRETRSEAPPGTCRWKTVSCKERLNVSDETQARNGEDKGVFSARASFRARCATRRGGRS